MGTTTATATTTTTTISNTHTSLQQLLRSFCHNSLWNYAIFWKLKHRSRMLLTWEDGYCRYSEPRDAVPHHSHDACFCDTMCSDRELYTHKESSAGYSMGLAVANMSCLVYALGEGAIGKVALTGKHSWVFAHVVNSKFVTEYPEEWHLQFAIGIKTILLVPVGPHGVVQLGSLEMVMEDIKHVALVKDLFHTYQNLAEDLSLFAFSADTLGPSFSLPFLGNFSVPSDTKDDLLNPTVNVELFRKGLVAHDVGTMTAGKPSGLSPLLSPHRMDQDSPEVSQHTDVLGRNSDAREAPYGNLTELSDAQNLIMSADQLENFPNFSCLEDELNFSSECPVDLLQYVAQTALLDNCNEFIEDSDLNTGALPGSYSKGWKVDGYYDLVAAEDVRHDIACSFLSFPNDSELHEALWPALQKACLSEPGKDGFGEKSLVTQSNWTNGNGPALGEADGCFVKGSCGAHLLDAIVTGAVGGLKEPAMATYSNIASLSSSSRQLASFQGCGRPSSCLLVDDFSPWRYAKSISSVLKRDLLSSSPTVSSPMATSILTDEGPPRIEPEYSICSKGLKFYQISKRKTRVGDNIQKPRPRDRQLIQDRVKELRDIVPNGSKCSIDALLHRTIKHMLFLRNVTNQVQKLKQCTQSKVHSSDVSASAHKDYASCAFELGGQPGIYPLTVENLDQPGHILVELLCEEHGLFMEIAQVIRHLELTILKGVMEKRSDKTWAHFVVEVSRGFQRMDILWPLMQLLQRTRDPISSKF